MTGCRPTEAAFIVFQKTITISDYDFLPSKWKASAPADFTKTGLHYRWLIPNESNDIVELVLKTTVTGFKRHEDLKTKLTYWYEKVMKDAGLEMENEIGDRLTMRSIRCHHATEWVKLDAEHKFMGLPKPPNPLQHESEATTRRHYAEKQVDDLEDTMKRCLFKWPALAKKRLEPEQRRLLEMNQAETDLLMIDTYE